MLTNTWTIESILFLGFDTTDVHKDTLDKNLKALKETGYFIFRQDSTYEIKIVGPKIDYGWWTLTKNDSMLTVYSNEVPAYYGIPLVPPETILEIELVTVTNNECIFKLVEKGQEYFRFLVTPKKKK